MQQIVNGLLYDTKNSVVVHTKKDTKRIMYQTTNGNFFMFYPTGEIVPMTEESARDYLGKYDVEKYVKIFGEPQEA